MFIAVIGIGQLVLCFPSQGQTADNAANSQVPAAPSMPPNPVDFFKQLLGKDREEQEKLLANRAPENRDQILAKVQEYKALNKNQCDSRLKATELRWHMRRLMTVAAESRPTLLAMVPENDRKMVEKRLQLWDKLPPEAKRQLQTNEATMTYFTMRPEQRTNYLAGIPLERRKKLQDGITELQAMPTADLQRLLGQFNLFFGFKPDQRQRVLNALPDAERQQIENTLKKFDGLPPSQREVCLQSFEKFTRMSIEERDQFLNNAERWELMTPAERQEWRNLVEDLSSLPPLPQDSDLPPLPMDAIAHQ